MLALRLDFLAGRYYATPWGRSVNEGNPEWPPAPFRLQRALISAWFESGCPRREVFEGILDLLGRNPPSYNLPPSVSGHVRHYMPGYGEDEKNKVFNSFTAPQGPVFVIWDSVGLDQEQEALLESLLKRLDYLGRSESWVEARLEQAPPPANFAVAGPDQEPDVILLCPVSSEEWSALRPRIEAAEKNRLLAKKASDGKKPSLGTKEREGIAAITPESYIDALAVETGVLRENGWQYPPASRRTGYRWTAGLPRSAMRQRRQPSARKITAARYLLSSEVLPAFTELVSVAERARKILMGIVGAHNGGIVPRELSGRSPDGEPIRSDHRHTFFIPEPGRNALVITHLDLYCPAGFPETVSDCLPRLDKVWGSGGHDIRLILLTTGTPETIGGFGRDQSLVMATAKEWASLSPFVPSRHLKIKRSEMRDPDAYAGAVSREIDRIVRQEIAFHGLPEPENVQLLPACPGLGYGIFLKGHFTSWLDFRTVRLTGGGSMGGQRPYGVRIAFPEPVTGPICLGYACHYGLGLFRPMTGSEGCER